MSQNFVRPQLQIAVCDDEPYARKRIQRLLENCLDKREISYTITLYGSGREFLEKPENLTGFDVVFLDINMEEIDGIQTAERIRSFHSDTYLVFITSYIHYALEGYRVNAVRYILKETLDTALEECVDAILEKMRISYVTFSFIQGELVWNFADFQASEGIMRVNGNKKGIFTRNRQPKDAAYLIKKRWEMK